LVYENLIHYELPVKKNNLEDNKLFASMVVNFVTFTIIKSCSLRIVMLPGVICDFIKTLIKIC